MATLSRNITHVKNTARIDMDELGWAIVDASRSSGAEICEGRLIVQGTAGDNTYADGYENGDGTSASKLVLGLPIIFQDTMGRTLDRKYIGASTGGRVGYIKATANQLFRIAEDGVASAIDSFAKYGYGYATILTGTVSPASGVSTKTNFPQIFSNDLLDSSDWHASTKHVANLQGATNDQENATIAILSARMVTFRITDTFRAW